MIQFVAIRSVIEDEEGARLIGIEPQRIMRLILILSGCLAALGTVWSHSTCGFGRRGRGRFRFAAQLEIHTAKAVILGLEQVCIACRRVAGRFCVLRGLLGLRRATAQPEFSSFGFRSHTTVSLLLTCQTYAACRPVERRQSDRTFPGCWPGATPRQRSRFASVVSTRRLRAC